MSDIFREVDEDLQRERALAMARKWGPWILGVVLVIVLGYGGYAFWQTNQRDNALARGSAFIAGLEQAAEDPAAGRAALSGLADDGNADFAAYVDLEVAALAAAQGDEAAAQAAWQAIATRSGTAPLLRDLAVLLEVAHQLDGTVADPQALRTRLQPLTAEGHPWRFTARELDALLLMAGGDVAGARAAFADLAAAEGVPQGIRRRAQALAEGAGA